MPRYASVSGASCSTNVFLGGKRGRAMTKSERYREILTALARHGIGIVDDDTYG